MSAAVNHARRADAVLNALRASGVQPRRLSTDSRTLKQGDVFLAYPGEAVDGRGFIAAAVAAGASAVVYERDGGTSGAAQLAQSSSLPSTRPSIPSVAVAGLKQLAGWLAHQTHGQPSAQLYLVGVTGTNGKTSTSQWIAQALALHRGEPVGIVGTLGIGYAGARALDENPNTTPDATVLHESLARFVAHGAHAVVMEVSSIGLDQGRVNGAQFDCAVLTNLSRDHLDYHGDMARYAQAKMRLFEFESLRSIVVNLDDVVGIQVLNALSGRALQRIGFSQSGTAGTAAASGVDVCLTAANVSYRRDRLALGLAFDVIASSLSGTERAFVQTSFIGNFNVANVLAVIGALVAADVSLDEAAQLIEKLSPVPGRMQQLAGTDASAPAVIVDYAHTPDALEKVLEAGRELARARGGRLIAVFGCGGDRDRGKRPMMGAVAVRLADAVVLTSDNPRSEAPQAIITEILAGIESSARDRVTCVIDRGAAIEKSIAKAASIDTIVLAGKGHEPYQEIARVRHPFSDLTCAEQALSRRLH